VNSASTGSHQPSPQSRRRLNGRSSSRTVFCAQVLIPRPSNSFGTHRNPANGITLSVSKSARLTTVLLDSHPAPSASSSTPANSRWSTGKVGLEIGNPPPTPKLRSVYRQGSAKCPGPAKKASGLNANRQITRLAAQGGVSISPAPAYRPGFVRAIRSAQPRFQTVGYRRLGQLASTGPSGICRKT